MLNITSKIKYGLRALLQIALEEKGKPVAIQYISDKQDISNKYLENIFKLLKKGSIVTSLRGPEGGYLLLKEPQSLTLLEIFSAIEGPLFITNCMNSDYSCSQNDLCGINYLWKDFQGYIEDYLERVTLNDLLTKELSKEKK